jgi:hypothetical protein
VGKRKAPAPRGYNPGGFRFPQRGAFYETPSRFAGVTGPAPVSVSSGADVSLLSVLSVATLAAARRRRG